MASRKISALAIAALLTLGPAAHVIGEDLPDFMQGDDFVAPSSTAELVAAREALMKEDGGILRGAGNLTGAEAVSAMQTLYKNYAHIPLLFPEGSEGGDALPAIWSNWDGFVAIVEQGKAGALAGIAAAEAGDAAAYGAALQQIGSTCGACHQQFRS